ncbi:TetR/AcrR family transcriptional regulator C-terminal domain-containing protein [Nocardia sp. 2]|uniref:TetR/AcrR family transcriptional regulator C-terminal domain-containing protein n=1 Tax=Nocardia acididurans TaxID=2802282 RepID=A0ABS1M6M3_9NOCA|nr:TetR/AcrR family transcriptional regulator [Nocardia acididurans]MBL1076265.1 TetR/AcrR family transcriptional regulator C-terminal domain-containing protein [Nocardia acididurans]
MDYSGSGDPQRTIELLWGLPAKPRRGPKPKLTVDDIAATAIRLADTDGLAAVTLRRVAEELGVTAMSLYGYVPSKAELLDLIADRVLRNYPGPDSDATPAVGWRPRLESIARANWSLYLAHPWLLQIAASRPVPGPNLTAKYDYELTAVDGLGLADTDMDLIIALINDYVRGAARTAVDAARAEAETGSTDQQWWEAIGPALAQAADPARFPVASRVGSAAGAEYGSAVDPARAFEFGLRRLLDGLERFIDDPNR